MMWKLRFLLFLFFMLWFLGALPGQAANVGPALPVAEPLSEVDRVIETARARGVGDPDPFLVAVYRRGEPIVFEENEPDGIRLGRALGQRQGLGSTSWPALTWADLLGATDSDRECRKAIDDACREAGHGGAKKDLTSITTHGDGCRTCAGDCQRNGAVGLITETATGCAERKKRDGKRGGS